MLMAGAENGLHLRDLSQIVGADPRIVRQMIHNERRQGKEVQVRMCSGHLEIYYGEMLLAKHQVQYHAGKMIWLPGQYKGLMERKGIATPYPAGDPAFAGR